MNTLAPRYIRPANGALARLSLAMLTALLSVGGAFATEALPPQTNIRLTIVQWVPTKSAYEKWDALGGDFKVSDTGTITLPLIGTIAVKGADPAELSAEIATRLQTRIGLVDKPEVTIAVVDYPPIFVVGDVATPGQYQYRPGMSVLQSLAVSGGERRTEGKNAASDQTGLVGSLRGLDNAILRGEIRVARLQAEMAEANDFTFKPSAGQDSAAAQAIYLQEKAIFAARANLLARQSKSFAELRDLLGTEIDNLDKKATGADADIDSVEKELRNVKNMVQKGIALPSRQGDLERMLRSYYAGRLDLTTATMRARQAISEASRNLEGINDKQYTDVVSDLQAEQANLDQLKTRRETTQTQLLDALSQNTDTSGPDQATALVYKIERRTNGVMQELAADEGTLLQPGDVVRVSRNASRDGDLSQKTAVLDTGISQ